MGTDTLFEEISRILDLLIQYQREEQDLILNRRAEDLPPLCEKINTLTQALGEKQEKLRISLEKGSVEPELQTIQRHCKERFTLLQELALQNHTLIESSLDFLEEVFAQILGTTGTKDVYTPSGFLPRMIGQSGGLLEVKV